jgi:hypothetical protein
VQGLPHRETRFTRGDDQTGRRCAVVVQVGILDWAGYVPKTGPTRLAILPCGGGRPSRSARVYCTWGLLPGTKNQPLSCLA